MDVGAIKNIVLIVTMICMAIFMVVAFIVSVKGPRFTDRLILVSAINSVINLFMVVFAVYSGKSYMVDVALVYSVIGFLAIAVLSKIFVNDYLEKNKKAIEKDQAKVVSGNDGRS